MSARRTHWAPSAVAYLRAFWGKQPLEQTAQHLRRTPKAVKRKAEILRLVATPREAAPVQAPIPARPLSDHRDQATAAVTSVKTRQLAYLNRNVGRPLAIAPGFDGALIGNGCRYPLWPHNSPPTFHFCNAPHIAGSSYCAEHTAKCYVQIRPLSAPAHSEAEQPETADA